MSYKNYVIVGRPNVGKSSLFNFFVKKREAVVKDEEGTTIDWRSKIIGNIKIWDTPGVFKINTIPVSDPDKIFFVIENNVLNDDKLIYLSLKKKYENIFVIVNKIDKSKETDDFSFFDNVIKISLKERIGLDDLVDIFFDSQFEKRLNDKKIWAIVGKPNVGKSTLINLLNGSYIHKVEDKEGTTLEFLPVDVDDKIFLDTPGQRKKAFFPKYEDVFGMIFVLDHRNERQDLRLINLAYERRKPCFVIINKTDLEKKDKIDEIEEKIKKFWNIDVLRCSFINLKNQNHLKSKIQSYMKKIEEAYFQRIKTNALNIWLTDNVKKTEPRIKFITQTSSAPPEFFADFELSQDKERMLKKRLSEAFGFQGIFIKVKYKVK